MIDRLLYISVINYCSAFAAVHSGVLHAKVHSLCFSSMHIKTFLPLRIHNLTLHSRADDLQLQMSAPPDKISELFHSMQSCMGDVKPWAIANMLNFNDYTTELMLVTSKEPSISIMYLLQSLLLMLNSFPIVCKEFGHYIRLSS